MLVGSGALHSREQLSLSLKFIATLFYVEGNASVPGCVQTVLNWLHINVFI